MKVVLLKSVDNLGTAGDAVEVKRGYFRNYLEPRMIALRATKENLEYVEDQREKFQVMVARETADAETIKQRLESLELHFQLRAGETGRLFGSVTAKDILARIKEQTGVEIERRKIEMDNLKQLGTHDVRLRVYPGVIAHVTAVVERLLLPGEEEEEAPEAAGGEEAERSPGEEVASLEAGFVEGEEAPEPEPPVSESVSEEQKLEGQEETET